MYPSWYTLPGTPPWYTSLPPCFSLFSGIFSLFRAVLGVNLPVSSCSRVNLPVSDFLREGEKSMFLTFSARVRKADFTLSAEEEKSRFYTFRGRRRKAENSNDPEP